MDNHSYKGLEEAMSGLKSGLSELAPAMWSSLIANSSGFWDLRVMYHARIAARAKHRQREVTPTPVAMATRLLRLDATVAFVGRGVVGTGGGGGKAPVTAAVGPPETVAVGPPETVAVAETVADAEAVA